MAINQPIWTFDKMSQFWEFNCMLQWEASADLSIFLNTLS